MTPQSNFMVAAPVRPGHEGALRALLAGMNRAPGIVDPHNDLIPFETFDNLHVARFVVLHDATLDDLAAYGTSFPDAPVWLVFLGDCDGPADAMLTALVSRAEEGLRQIFWHCTGFDPGPDLLGWMRAHSFHPAAQYINWVGRTVRQIHEEAALHVVLRAALAQDAALAGQAPAAIRERLITAARRDGSPLTPPARTPPGWLVRQWVDLIGFPLVLLVLSPIMLLITPFFLWTLRRRERSDPVITPRPTTEHVAALSRIEDHDVSNQFSAFGSVKPGWFRLATLLFVFRLLQFSTQHIYTRGRLARVGTIHFARWVFLDGHRRLLFASNYDGSLDSYMDDFINKVAYGLNLVFSNGVGWPRTLFLLAGGASIEQPFKNYLRRHQVPTDVWYKAYPGLTASDLATNTAIREGFERRHMTEAETRQWLALI